MKGRFGLYISILERSGKSYFLRELAPLGLGPGQQAYLLALFPGETVHQEEIAKRLKVDKANVTRAVKSLEAMGYIKRRKDISDKRARQILLTSEGIEVRTSVEKIASKWLEQLKSGIDDEEWKNIETLLGQVVKSALSMNSRTASP